MIIQTDKYKSEIIAKLNPFIENLKMFINDYEQAIVQISNNLPDLEIRINNKIKESKAVLVDLFSENTNVEVFSIKREFLDFQKQIDIILFKLKEMDKIDRDVFLNLKEAIAASMNNIERVASISDISESLKVYAINSIVNSRKVGLRGKGHQVISTEFIHLSEIIATSVQKITELDYEIKKEVAEYLEGIKSLEEIKKKHLELISDDSSRILQNTKMDIDRIAETLDRLINQIELSKNPTYDIMIELQTQDIIHQQLTHLVDNMNDIFLILEDNTRLLDLPFDEMTLLEQNEYRSLYTLLIFIIENTQHQMIRITDDFKNMLNNLEVLCVSMKEAAEGIAVDSTEYLGLDNYNALLKENKNRIDINNRIITRIFEPPIQLIYETINDMHHIVELKSDVSNKLGFIKTKIAEENTNARSLLPIVNRINNLLLLSQIEQARHLLNFSYSKSNRFFLESFEELSDTILGIGKAYNLILNNNSAISKIFQKQEEEYEDYKIQFDNFINIINNSQKIFTKQFSAIVDISEELVTCINGYTNYFHRLRSLSDEIQHNVDVCSEIKDSMKLKVERIGGMLPIDQCHFKSIIYDNIVQKCTVDQERTTIKEQFDIFNIEDSDGCRITLF